MFPKELPAYVQTTTLDKTRTKLFRDKCQVSQVPNYVKHQPQYSDIDTMFSASSTKMFRDKCQVSRYINQIM